MNSSVKPTKDDIDVTEAHAFYRDALLRVLATLFAAAGMAVGGAPVARLPRIVRCGILRELLPAESAARRLFVFMARRVTLPPEAGPVVAAGKPTIPARSAETGRARKPVFRLFDRLKFFPELADRSKRVARGPGPRIWLLDGTDPVPPLAPEKQARDPDDAVRLCRRMQALQRALEHMPAHARRLAREIARRAKAPPGPGRCGPIRPGLPPGHRHRASREVDGLLRDCHAMVFHDRGPQPDTS